MKIPRVRIMEGNDEPDEIPSGEIDWKRMLQYGSLGGPPYISTSGMMFEEYKQMMSPHDDMPDAMCRCVTTNPFKEPKRVYFSKENIPNVGTMVYVDILISKEFGGFKGDKKYIVSKHYCNCAYLKNDEGEDYAPKYHSMYILEGDEPEQKQERIYFSDDNLPNVGDMVYYDSTKRFDSHESFLTDGGRYKYCEYKYSDIGYLENDDGNKSTAWFENCYILSNEVKWGVEKFEVGKWYVCRLRKYPGNWSDDMNKWFDGEPQKCVGISVRGIAAKFSDVIHRKYYDDVLDDFREVPAP